MTSRWKPDEPLCDRSEVTYGAVPLQIVASLHQLDRADACSLGMCAGIACLEHKQEIWYQCDASGTIKELELDALGGLNQITFHPDGNLWFAGASRLGWISPSGKATNINISGQGRTFLDLTAGPDGHVWFIGIPNGLQYAGGSPIPQGASESVGFVGTNGQIREWQFPATGIGVYPTLQYVVVGPDGNLWYARSDGDTCFIGRITPTGNRTEFTVFTGLGRFSGLAVGPDGNLWFQHSTVWCGP